MVLCISVWRIVHKVVHASLALLSILLMRLTGKEQAWNKEHGGEGVGNTQFHVYLRFLALYLCV